jgi:hypothetical protein
MYLKVFFFFCSLFRASKKKVWEIAAQMLTMNESRVREEVRRIDGEECYVWRWIDVSKRGLVCLGNLQALCV